VRKRFWWQSATKLRAVSVAVSLLLHVAALALLVVLDWLGGLQIFLSPSVTNHSITLVARQSSGVAVGWQGVIDGATSERVERSETDDSSEIQRLLAKQGLQPARDSEDMQSMTEDGLKRRLTSAIAEAQALPEEGRFERLEGLADSLERISSEQAVEEVTRRLGQSFGVKPRATRPADELVEGVFDVSTAQLHAVDRMESEEEGVSYKLVLVDAAGRKQEQQLGAAEGESLYRTWQIIQKNPLLERIYRGVVMQLLDQALGR
jgi:hypothetical protein